MFGSGERGWYEDVTLVEGEIGELAELAGELVRSAEERMALFAALDKMAGRRDEGYGPEMAALIKLSVMRRMDDDTAVQGFMEEQIRFEKIRQALARFHLAKGDLEQARNICYEWLDNPLPRKPGLHDYFWVVLLEVAEAAGDREEQSRLCEISFRDRGDFEYLERLKELIGAEEWPAYRAGLLERIEGDRGNWIYLGALYVHEEMWAALLAYVEKHPRIVDNYYEYLAPRYPREVSGVYEQLALETLQEKVNRKGYRKVCRYLKVMQRLGEQERVQELVAEWRVEYEKRPALLDELDKNFGRPD